MIYSKYKVKIRYYLYYKFIDKNKLRININEYFMPNSINYNIFTSFEKVKFIRFSRIVDISCISILMYCVFKYSLFNKLKILIQKIKKINIKKFKPKNKTEINKKISKQDILNSFKPDFPASVGKQVDNFFTLKGNIIFK